MLTPAQRARVAERVRAARAEKGWDQRDLAARAKIAVGTVQSIERNLRATRDDKVTAIATALGLSIDDLLQTEAPLERSDPRLKDLKEEDIRVAQLYHHASSAVREQVRALLRDRERTRVTVIVDQLLFLPEEDLAILEASLQQMASADRAAPTAPKKNSS